MISPASDTIATNLYRLMTQLDLSVEQTAQRSGLDERTIRAVLSGTGRPHTRSLRKLADGLDVSVDELFLSSSLLVHRQFDKDTNPAIGKVVAENPDLFENWTAADFEEIYSRVGTGGGLAPDGVLDAARAMNRRRELIDKLAVVLDGSQGKLVAGIIEMAHQQATGF
jgi:transcriptional regulator with XRE-family HTH domain